MKKIVVLLIILLGTNSCELWRPEKVVETNTGQNVLGFTLNGTYISYKAGLGKGELIRNHVFGYYNDTDSTFEITASLYNSIWKELTIHIPANNIIVGESTEDVSFNLEYTYSLTHDPNGNGSYTVNKFVENTTGEVMIRYWDKDLKIIAGNFSFSGTAPQNNDTVIQVLATDGLFDINYSY